MDRSVSVFLRADPETEGMKHSIFGMTMYFDYNKASRDWRII